jgi:acetyl-CoA carboxylase biotin carboxyl carrier protein
MPMSIGELREHALIFAGNAPGPLRLLRMRVGDVLIEVQWQDTAATAASLATAGPALASDPPAAAPGASPPGTAGAGPARPGQVGAADEQLVIVTSPMVGTFYRAPAPGADPFVTVGDLVEPGQTIGIVEAMKLMNQIAAESGGRVIEILADDGQPVEFGQALVALGEQQSADGNGAGHPARS